MTHIDPFAPGDSPQHPANWGKVAVAPRSLEDTLADICQWQRDHFAMASEADADIEREELQQRHERYDEYFDEYGTEDEDYKRGGEFLPFPELLRRAVFADLDDEEIDEWKALFEQHSTDDERDPLWVEDVLPELPELQARARVTDLSGSTIEAAEEPQDGKAAPEDLPAVPKGNALKEDWVEYALAVDKARGGTLTFEQADAMTKDELKAAYKPQAS